MIDEKKAAQKLAQNLIRHSCLIASTPSLRESIMRNPNKGEEQSPMVCERWAITTKMKKVRDL